MNKTNEEIIKQIPVLYLKGYKICEICKQLNLSSGTVKRYVVLSQCKLREKYHRLSCNMDFFERIDSEAKAYFLGFILADGCVMENCLEIGLNKKDKSILDLFKKEIEFTGDVHFKGEDGVRLTITSNKLIEDLKKYNCTERKSLTLIFPQNIPENMMHHFIRGFFDGDGTVHINKISNQIIMNIVGTIDVCNNINTIFNKMANLPIYKINVDKRTVNFGAYQCGGTKKVYEIYKFLYKDSTIFLERKKKIFDEYFKFREKNLNHVKASKYIGVLYDKARKKYVAQIWDKTQNRSKILGRFSVELDAARFREDFILKNNLHKTTKIQLNNLN